MTTRDSVLRLGVRLGQGLSEWCYALLGEVTWVAHDGRTMLLREMTDDHLANAIRVIQRRGEDPTRTPVLLHLKREQEGRRRRGFR